MAFGKQYSSGNRKFCLYITIACAEKKRFRVWAEEYGKKNSKYVDREITVVDGKMTIHLNFPMSPEELFIGIMNIQTPGDSAFEVTMMEAPLKTYNIYMDEPTKRFVNHAAHLSAICGYESAAPNGRPFISPGKEFNITFFDVIKDGQGRPMGTPARIGHESGIIQIAKTKFDRYTIPMRMIILLHEFSHKYKNPKIGVQISNEFGADINALYIYLGLGFSKIDAIVVFSKVFLRAQSDGNMERIRLIYDYCSRFEAGEFAQVN